MKPSLVKHTLKVSLEANKRVLLVGAPGCGKTDMVHQVMEELGWEMLYAHAGTEDPTDRKGMPKVDSEMARWVPFEEMYRLIHADKPITLFGDDFGHAVLSTQSPWMQMLHGGHLNGFTISPHVRIVLATNHKTAHMGVSGVIEPVKSRCTIIEVDIDTNDWCKWAIDHDIPIPLIACVRFAPELLTDFEPTSEIRNTTCPRNIAEVGDILKLPYHPSALGEVIEGRVGKGSAAKIMGFLRDYEHMPNLDQIVLDPDGASGPASRSILCAIITGLVHKAGPNNLKNIFRYVDRVAGDKDREFAVLLLQDIARRRPELTKHAAFTTGTIKYQDLLR